MNNQAVKISPDAIKKMVTYALFLVAVAVLLLLTYILIPPLFQKNLRLIMSNDQGKKEVVELKRALEILSSTDTTNLSDNLAKVTLALPDEKKVSGLITGLNILASQAPVVIKYLDFSPGEISTVSGQPKSNFSSDKKLPEGVSTTLVEVDVTGKFDGVAKFVSDLNTVSQLIGVQTVNIQEDVGGVYTANISLYLYFQPKTRDQVVWKNLEIPTEEDQQIIDSLTAKDVFVVN